MRLHIKQLKRGWIMKMGRVASFVSRGLILVTVLLSGVGCAAMTEPKVKAYIQEKKAYADIKKGNLEQAAVELKLALGNDPTEPTILNNLAYIEFTQGHFDKAIGFLEQARALRNDDNDEPYIMNEARILIAHHEYHHALALLSLIEPRHSWPKGYQKIMAEALLHNGQSSRALAILLDRRNLNPEQSHP
jgi:tetratricopeptide (TPR) repeat protein